MPILSVPIPSPGDEIDPVALDTVAPAAVEDLLDAVFGPDRRTRTAYRLRAGCTPLPLLSRALLVDGALAALIQAWPVALTADDGCRHPLVLVGPVAVRPDRQQAGLGRRLMRDLLAAAGEAAPLMLIGDPEYYGRFFGFGAGVTGRWRLPGPFEPHRLLARGPVPAVAGVVGPDPAR